jgi:hypothetical protein
LQQLQVLLLVRVPLLQLLLAVLLVMLAAVLLLLLQLLLRAAVTGLGRAPMWPAATTACSTVMRSRVLPCPSLECSGGSD